MVDSASRTAEARNARSTDAPKDTRPAAFAVSTAAALAVRSRDAAKWTQAKACVVLTAVVNAVRAPAVHVPTLAADSAPLMAAASAAVSQAAPRSIKVEANAEHMAVPSGVSWTGVCSLHEAVRASVRAMAELGSAARPIADVSLVAAETALCVVRA